ncbi:hypothetical protein QYF61_016329, partial [Mycteria americana]
MEGEKEPCVAIFKEIAGRDLPTDISKYDEASSGNEDDSPLADDPKNMKQCETLPEAFKGDDQDIVDMVLRKVLHPLTCYIDFPEQLLLYEAQGVNDGSRVDDEGDPLTGTVQERHISDVPFQDFHLSLTLELCKGSRKQSKRPYRHPKKSTERSGEGLEIFPTASKGLKLPSVVTILKFTGGVALGVHVLDPIYPDSASSPLPSSSLNSGQQQAALLLSLGSQKAALAFQPKVHDTGRLIKGTIQVQENEKRREEKRREEKRREEKRREEKRREGKGREGKGREGKGREGKGREGKGREGKGREGKGREGKGREGKGREGKGREGKGREGKGREGKGREGKGREGKGREGKGREGKGREGKGREGKGREGKGREGKGKELLVVIKDPSPPGDGSGRSSIQLPSTMIGHNNSLNSVSHCQLCIFFRQDAFDDDGQFHVGRKAETIADIITSFARVGQICSEDKALETQGLRPLDQMLGNRPVAVDVELEPPEAARGSRGDLLQCAGGVRAGNVTGVHRFGRFGRWQITMGQADVYLTDASTSGGFSLGLYTTSVKNLHQKLDMILQLSPLLPLSGTKQKEYANTPVDSAVMTEESTNVMLEHETEMTFWGSVSNYSMEQLVREPTGANAVLSFVALALPVEAPLCDSDHRGLSFTSSTGAPQAKYATAIVLSFKKSYAEMRRLVKKKLESFTLERKGYTAFLRAELKMCSKKDPRGSGWRLNHFPGQPVPMLDNPFTEEKFPNIQSKPPLAQLEAISSCPITCYLGEETDPNLSTTSFQAKPPQLPQSLLIRHLLQTLHQLRCPPLDTLQHLNIPLVVGGPKLNTVFKVQPHQCRVQGHDHFPSPAGHAIFDTSQDAVGFLGRLGTLLAHIQAVVNQHPQVLLCQAAFQPLFPKPVALHGVAVAQVQDLALGLVKPHTIDRSPSIQPVQVPLQSLPTLQQINTPTQLGVICKLTESTLDPFVQIIDKDVKQNWPQHRALGNTACDRPPTGVNSIHHHSLGPAVQPVLYQAKSTPVQAMSSQFLQENALCNAENRNAIKEERRGEERRGEERRGEERRGEERRGEERRGEERRGEERGGEGRAGEERRGEERRGEERRGEERRGEERRGEERGGEGRRGEERRGEERRGEERRGEERRGEERRGEERRGEERRGEEILHSAEHAVSSFKLCNMMETNKCFCR